MQRQRARRVVSIFICFVLIYYLNFVMFVFQYIKKPLFDDWDVRKRAAGRRHRKGYAYVQRSLPATHTHM